MVAGVGDDRRHDDGGRDRGGDFPRIGERNDGQLAGLVCHFEDYLAEDFEQ